MADGGLLRNVRLWGFATTAARDAFGTRKGVRVGDHAVLQGSSTFAGGLYRCTAAGLDSSTWAAAVGSGQLDASQFPTAPGIITPPMLANGAARSVLGVSGNASAARADIASGGSRRALMSDSSNAAIAFRAIALEDLPSITLDTITDVVRYTVDFSTLPNNALSGTESLDSRNWVIGNQGNATLFEILNGSGLHFDASTTSTAFTSASQTAPYATVTWSQLLGTAFNPSRRYRVDCRLSSITLATNNNSFCFGITPAASGFSQLGFVRLLRTGGTLGARHDGPGASSVGYDTSAAYDTFSLLISHDMVRSYAAVWGGSYPELRSMTYLGSSQLGSFASAEGSSGLLSTARLFFAFTTGETGGAADVVVRELRVVELR